MSAYTWGMYVWASVFAVGGLAAVGALAIRETCRAVDCLRRQQDVRFPSHPSFPRHSAPSHPGA